MMNYFTTVVDIDTTLKVLSNKGNGPEQDVKIIGKEKGIEYIAHQYPGDGKEGIANKFTYEFVSLHDDVNGRKERVSFVASIWKLVVQADIASCGVKEDKEARNRQCLTKALWPNTFGINTA
jgi:hypothetical protein